ncbi:MAG: 4-hydroxythreonine-4-phosphate dehydrogenase PdxA [Deltaproteobacteria bacterium]|nr:4-hydroxythreonine-4-phosphate dehydrogenase PdxA [Deltaproteobacteria bacterium]
MNTSQNLLPRVAVVMGDATGIGPELVAKSLSMEETRRLCRPAVIGDARVMEEAVRLTRVSLRILPRKNWDGVSGQAGLMEMFDLANLDPQDYRIGEVNARAGQACLQYLELAITQAMEGKADAVIFAPLNKQAMHLAGSPHKSQLAFIAHLTKADRTGEINVLDNLWTSRVTSHIGFREICSQLTADRVSRAITLLDQTMRRGGVEKPRIGVAALNPHAGEKGLFGPEEEMIIGPAVDRARGAGMDVRGPFPADTIFVRARKGEFCGVVTMYHDQGQIATKILGFDRGVTVSGGLPVVVATPAHGTAHDIAGKGVADVGAFQAALRITVRMAQSAKRGGNSERDGERG